MNRLQRQSAFDLDKFFNGFYQTSPTVKTADKVFSPRVDIYENEEGYQLEAELAGFKKEAINISVEDSVLTIQTSNEPQTNSEQANKEVTDPRGKVLRKERISGKFSRSFKLGQDIDTAGIQAQFTDGVLILSVPKAQEAVVKPLQIEIH